MQHASLSIHVKQLKTAKCKSIATALQPTGDDIIDCTSLRSSVTSSKNITADKLIMRYKAVADIPLGLDNKVKKSAIIVKTVPATEKELPTMLSIRKMLSCDFSVEDLGV